MHKLLARGGTEPCGLIKSNSGNISQPQSTPQGSAEMQKEEGCHSEALQSGPGCDATSQVGGRSDEKHLWNSQSLRSMSIYALRHADPVKWKRSNKVQKEILG